LARNVFASEIVFTTDDIESMVFFATCMSHADGLRGMPPKGQLRIAFNSAS